MPLGIIPEMAISMSSVPNGGLKQLSVETSEFVGCQEFGIQGFCEFRV